MFEGFTTGQAGNQFSIQENEIKFERVDDLGKKTRKISGVRLRNGSYYADTSANGHPLTKRIGPESMPTHLVKAIRDKMKVEAFKEEHFPTKSKGLQVREVCNEYGEKHLMHIKSGENRIHLFKPIDRLIGKIACKDLRISDVEEYRRKRLQEHTRVNGKETGKFVTISTVNHEVKELLMALQWALRERLIEFNPIAGIEHLKEPAPARVQLDDGAEDGKEWLKLYEKIGERSRHTGKLTIRGQKNRLKFLIQYKTGMRIGEINALQYNWIDQPALIINLPAGATKGEKARTVPAPIEVFTEINEYVSAISKTHYFNDRFLFWNPQTGEHDKSSYKAFNNAVDRAGLDRKITSHALRRTRGTIWDGIDERASMEALGHADYKVHRKHYTKVTEDRMRSLVEKPEENRMKEAEG